MRLPVMAEAASKPVMARALISLPVGEGDGGGEGGLLSCLRFLGLGVLCIGQILWARHGD